MQEEKQNQSRDKQILAQEGMDLASDAASSQLAGSKSGNFEGYLIFDFQDFQGLVQKLDSNTNEQKSQSDNKQQQQNLQIFANTNNPTSMQNAASSQENIRNFPDYSPGKDDQDDEDDEKKLPPLNFQGMEYLEKTKDKQNYDEFYTFLMGLDFLNISNTRNRVDPILMDQFKSLMKIKEYFVMLKCHIDRITENDSDLWFDELKNTFKLMLHQFENMINSISEQINPVSLSVCFFRCIEYIKIFDRFVHMRAFHQQNVKGGETAIQKFHRSVKLCLLWKRLTGNDTFDKFIHHLDSEPFNCGTCEKCKRDLTNQLLKSFQNNIQSTISPIQNNLVIKPDQQFKESQTGFQSALRNNVYQNTKIFKDIQEGFAKMIEKDITYFKKYERSNPSEDQELRVSRSEFTMADRGNSFRQLISPISKSSKTTEFYLA